MEHRLDGFSGRLLASTAGVLVFGRGAGVERGWVVLGVEARCWVLRLPALWRLVPLRAVLAVEPLVWSVSSDAGCAGRRRLRQGMVFRS